MNPKYSTILLMVYTKSLDLFILHIWVFLSCVLHLPILSLSKPWS
jgi:hypothetical protein